MAGEEAMVNGRPPHPQVLHQEKYAVVTATWRFVEPVGILAELPDEPHRYDRLYRGPYDDGRWPDKRHALQKSGAHVYCARNEPVRGPGEGALEEWSATA